MSGDTGSGTAREALIFWVVGVAPGLVSVGA